MLELHAKLPANGLILRAWGPDRAHSEAVLSWLLKILLDKT